MDMGWSFPKRKKYLEDLSKKKTGKTQRERFQNELVDFDIHKVPIELPKYRLENGRTYAAQAQYIALHDLPEDFFSKDPESEQAQKVQHEILKNMIHEKGLFNFFKNKEQDSAIILSHDGFVINGNRRLCAWREHYDSDRTKYKKFSHVDVIILPPADPRDIDELEARLQEHQDIKADYSWIARALMWRKRRDEHHYTDDDLVVIYEKKKGEIRELFDMLSYAESYLEDRDKKGQYTSLDKDEYAFRQLVKRRGKVKSEAEKEVFERVAYCLIDEPGEDEAVGGRLYQSIPDVADHLDKIVQNINDELGDDDGESPTETHELLGGEAGATLGGVIDILHDENKYPQVRNITLDVIEGEKVKEKEKKKQNFVFYQVRNASTSLAEAVMAIGPKTKKDGIAAQIEAIEGSLDKIGEWLGNEDQS